MSCPYIIPCHVIMFYSIQVNIEVSRLLSHPGPHDGRVVARKVDLALQESGLAHPRCHLRLLHDLHLGRSEQGQEGRVGTERWETVGKDFAEVTPLTISSGCDVDCVGADADLYRSV